MSEPETTKPARTRLPAHESIARAEAQIAQRRERMLARLEQRARVAVEALRVLRADADAAGHAELGARVDIAIGALEAAP